MRSRPFIASTVFLALVAAAVPGCIEAPIWGNEPVSNAMVVEQIKTSGVERMDILLAIDNSGSMGDKQEILRRAVPDLVQRLANPSCVDGSGAAVAEQPAGPREPCPIGSEREFLAVPDIHIGIVSSSLGGPQGMTCAAGHENDRAHLIARDSHGGEVSTYQGGGFLAWDPDKKLDPPGESVLNANGEGLIPTLQEMVKGVEEDGCVFEAQLESWYRFLIQPDPYWLLDRDGDDVVERDVDETILAQRKAFLRPDSLVAIIMLTDENDCSLAPGKGAARLYDSAPMVKPRSACAESGPDDACCAPCDTPASELPAQCGADPACVAEDGSVALLSYADDNLTLRCFDQKRRFGKSYLYPVERYVKGLTEPKVPDRHGKLAPNPLYTDLDPEDDLRQVRGTSSVFLTGIVGVPWQDIARDPTTLTKGLKSAKELAERDEQGRTTWDVILGDPAKGKAPLDPHMLEATGPRSGENPITGTALAPPSAGYNADPISGHEHPKESHHLQYSCTFPLLDPFLSKECNSAQNPICQLSSGAYSDKQQQAKAYPGVRELDVLKGVEEQAIVASVCPASWDAATPDDAPDFGYRPAIGALIDRLRGKLGHQCLPRQLTPRDDGQVGCLVIEARESESCSCSAAEGRTLIAEEHQEAVLSKLREELPPDDASNCFCEVPQLAGDELTACQTEKGDPLVVDEKQVNGWCYIDGASVPPVGSPDLVPEACVGTEPRLVRMVGTGKSRPGSTLFVMCLEDGSGT